jgi:hypothetical protein
MHRIRKNVFFLDPNEAQSIIDAVINNFFYDSAAKREHLNPTQHQAAKWHGYLHCNLN